METGGKNTNSLFIYFTVMDVRLGKREMNCRIFLWI